jgi:hypothetical protein
MLAVGVDREHRPDGRLAPVNRVKAHAQGCTFPAPRAHPYERRSELRRERLELARDGLVRAVVDDRQPTNVAEHLLDQRPVRHLTVTRHHRPHVFGPESAHELACFAGRAGRTPVCAKSARIARALP